MHFVRTQLKLKLKSSQASVQCTIKTSYKTGIAIHT